jgi:arylsulfatase A-like enzyme
MGQISRRHFLKLLLGTSLLPLIKISWPRYGYDTNQPATGETPPNVLVLVFDTLSARHMSLYGYQRNTTPNLNRFAARATVFHNYHVSGNFTSPTTASILTGTYPWSHRAFHLHATVDEKSTEKNVFGLLPGYYYKVAYTHNLLVTSLLHQFDDAIDLFKPTRELCLADGQFADLLFSDDYSVAFWSEWLYLRGGGAPPGSLFLSMANRGRVASQKRRINQQYGRLFPRGIPNLHSLHFILEDAINWIRDEVTSMPTPFFGYFHLLPPHEPYTTRRDFIDVFKDGWTPVEKPAGFASQRNSQDFLNEQRRWYDEYLAYTDSEFGRLYDALEHAGVLDNTYLVITSDHGELFERGIRGHVTPTLYEPLLHVPLVVSSPGQERRVDVLQHASCVDLMPTFLHLTGQAIPSWCEGRVLPAFGGDEPHPKRSIYAMEAKSNPKYEVLDNATVAIIQDNYKLIYYTGYGDKTNSYELYDLANDPEEMEDLFTRESSVGAALNDELMHKLDEVNTQFRQ